MFLACRTRIHCLLLLAGGMVVLPAIANTIHVNTVDDGSVAGKCTLRDAIQAANTNTAQKACVAGSVSGQDVIEIPSGVYNLSDYGHYWDEDANLTGDLDITSNMTLQGADVRTTVIVAPLRDRIFDVAPNGMPVTLGINNLTLVGGNVAANVSNNGGVLNSYTTSGLHLGNIVARGGSAQGGGNLYIDSSSDRQVTLDNVSILDGSAQGGAGVYLWDHSVTNSSGPRFNNVTLSGNSLPSNSGIGSGMFVRGYLFLDNSTVTANSGGTGGMYLLNQPDQVWIANSIVQGNTNYENVPVDVYCGYPDEFYGSNFYSLIGTQISCRANEIGTVSGDARLSPLFDFGAGIPVHAVLPGSVALHAGVPDSGWTTHCLGGDARGVPRPPTACDIGAYQAQYDATVNSTADLPDAAPGDGVCATISNTCTVRAAAMEASASGGRWITRVPVGTYVLDLPQGPTDGLGDDIDIQAPAGTPQLNFALIGDGNADQIELVGSNSRVLDVHGRYDGGATGPNPRPLAFALINATLRGGHLTVDPFAPPGQANYLKGAGINIDAGRSLLYNIVIRNNVVDAHALPDVSGFGGGITANLEPEKIGANNQALPYSSSLRLERFAIVDNQVIGGGAGGGNFYAYVPHADFPTESLVFLNGTISGNEAVNVGGLATSGKQRMAFVTVTNNRATTPAAPSTIDGIALSGGQVSKSIFAGNGTGASARNCSVNTGTSTYSLGYLLIGDSHADCLLPGDATGNLYNVDPRLAPLQTAANGMPVHRLLSGSPALDAIPWDACTDGDGLNVHTDARGVPRTGAGLDMGENCTIGSVEGDAVDLIFANGFESP